MDEQDWKVGGYLSTCSISGGDFGESPALGTGNPFQVFLNPERHFLVLICFGNSQNHDNNCSIYYSAQFRNVREFI